MGRLRVWSIVVVALALGAVGVTGGAASAHEQDLPADRFVATDVPGLSVAVDGLVPASTDVTNIDLGSVRVGLPDVVTALGLQSHQEGMHSVSRVFLMNTSGAPMTIESVATTGSGDFFTNHTFTPPFVLASGAQASIKVGFWPSSPGTKSATLQIQTSAGLFPVALTGRGVEGNVLYRIGSGGPKTIRVGDGSTPSFGVDTQAQESTYFRLPAQGATRTTDLDTEVNQIHESVPAGTPIEVFQTLRKSFEAAGTKPSDIVLAYDFPVISPGPHLVRVYFADSEPSAARLFDVYAEGQRTIEGFSISTAAGGINRGVARAFVVDSDDVLTVELRNRDLIASKLTGIEVIRVSSVPAVTTALDFGPVVEGAAVTRDLVIRNNGGPSAAAFRVDGLSFSGPGAADLKHGMSGRTWLAPGESLAVPVTFKPSAQGPLPATATFSIWGDLEATANVSGSGVVPQGTLNAPNTLAFDPVRVGGTATERLTLTNPSGSTVFVAGAAITGSEAFSIGADSFPLTVPARATRELTVEFSPTEAANASATLRIEHTGTNRPATVTLNGTVLPRFTDTAGSVFGGDIEWLAASGITRGCNPPANDRFCPDDFVTRGQMAAFFVRGLGLEIAGDGFADTAGHVFDGDVRRLAAAGVTRGCNPPANDRFCPDDLVTRGQMAAFFVRGLGLEEPGGGFDDTAGHIFDGDVRRLAAAGVTRGCNPPANTRFCADDHVTRGQMAAFFHRAAALMGD